MTEIEKLRSDNAVLSKANLELQVANTQLEALVHRYIDKALDDSDEIYDQCETHEHCTVEIWSNSRTGKQSFGWRKEK